MVEVVVAAVAGSAEMAAVVAVVAVRVRGVDSSASPHAAIWLGGY